MRTLLFIAALMISGCAATADLPVYGVAPEFSLTERGNRIVNNRELQGRVWIADFIFTRCGGMCPIMTMHMRRLTEQLPAEVRFVSFTVDPEHDTPAVLAEYAERHAADPQRWMFLTGDRNTLYAISREGFKLAVDDTMGDEIEPITHSSRFVLVDQEGRIRGYYGMEDEGSMERLIADAVGSPGTELEFAL